MIAHPAGIGRRFGAMLYDSLLLIAIWMGTLFVWVIASSGEAVSGIFVQLVLVLEVIAFFLFFWRRDGQTLGMQAWRIKIVGLQGEKPSTIQLIKRLACAPLSLLCVGLGYVWLLFNDDKLAWHDQLSATRVVYIPKEQE